MALIPARVKYRRVHRLPYEGHAKGNTELSFGEYGLIKVQNDRNGYISYISPFGEGLRFESDEIREPKFLIKKNRKIYGTRKE